MRYTSGRCNRRFDAKQPPSIRVLYRLAAILVMLLVGTARATLPLNVHFSEDFSYPAMTDLTATATWDGTATNNEMEIDSAGSWLKFTGGSGTPNAYRAMSYTGSGNMIYIHILAKPGTGTETLWSLYFDDASSNNLARWYGSGTTCRGRIGGSAVVTDVRTLNAGQWNDLDVRINTSSNLSEFYLNNFYMGSLDHTVTPSNTLGRIRFERINNSLAASQTICFDELRVGQSPTLQITVPAAPTVTAPATGSILHSQTPAIQWSGDLHDIYEVHVNTTNNAADTNGWNSGQVTSTGFSCTSGFLQKDERYYIFVRLHNPGGWGPWSASGRYFDVTVPATIIPAPQQITWDPGTGFQVNAQTQIVMPTNPDAKDQLAANQLQRKVWDMTEYLPPIIQGGAGAPTTNVIAIGDSARNTAVAAIIAAWPEAIGKIAKSEGYLFGVNNSSIVIQGFDQKGTFYGCQSLILLLEYFRNNAVTGLFCYDYPDLPMRGILFRSNWQCDWEFPKEIISEVMARYKINCMEPVIGKGLHWEYPARHGRTVYEEGPLINRQDIIGVVNFARQHYVDTIACGPGPNNSNEMITALNMNADLRENKTAADWPSGGGGEDLCPRNPAAMQLVNDIRDELIDLFQPTYMHIGQSEYRALGHFSCSRCAGTSPAVLLNEFLWNDYNYLNAKGVIPTMWADMLRADQNGGPTGWNTSSVVSTMPKEIFVQDWEYGLSGNVPTNYPSLQIWTSNGLQSGAVPFGFGYHANAQEGWSQNYGGIENIYYWATSAKNYGSKGFIAFNKLQTNDKRPTLNSDLQTLQLACFPFVAEWGWAVGKTNWNPAPYDGRAMIFARLAPDRPSSFAASTTGTNVNLTWTNPADFTYQPVSTFQGTYICYRTDRVPTSPIDGTFVADVSGSPNTAESFAHTPASSCSNLYYAAFAHDDVRHFSAAATVTLTAAVDTDGDGVGNACDECPNTITGMIELVDAQGCPPAVAGDFDRDGDVDDSDYAVFDTCAGGANVPPAAGCESSDCDADSDVDQADFGLVQRCFSGTDVPADLNCAG